MKYFLAITFVVFFTGLGAVTETYFEPEPVVEECKDCQEISIPWVEFKNGRKGSCIKDLK